MGNLQLHFVECASQGKWVELKLNHPPLNIINIAMLEEINHTLKEISADKSKRCLLIHAEGRCFSAGMDIADHMPERVDKMLSAMQEMFQLLYSLAIPSISAVHGSVFGGGLELAAFTDLTFAAENAKLGQPEIKLGVFPPLAVAYFSQLIGPKMAYDLILTGRTIDAEEAFRIGLVNAVLTEDQLLERSREAAEQICSHSRAALAITKKAFRNTAGSSMPDALRLANKIYKEELMSTEDAVEGLLAFLQKRTPEWKDA